MRITIDLNGETPTISGDLAGILVVVEAARRDLNAMAQALGASSEFKADYGRLAQILGAAAVDVPRINPMDRSPFAALTGRACAHPDDPNPTLPQVDGSDDIEDLLS